MPRRAFQTISALAFSAIFLAVPFFVFAAAATPGTCSSGSISESEVGPILGGICRECYKLGDCSVTDIMVVIANVGNYVVGIIASLVFLMYILGGIWWLGSHGDKAWVEKGKKYIKGSTIGLLIVLFAYAGVTSLKLALETGKTPEGSNIVICDGSTSTEGRSCGLNSTCTGGQCLSKCQITYPDTKMCLDTVNTVVGRTASGCVTNYCPGGDEVKCCDIPELYKVHVAE